MPMRNAASTGEAMGYGWSTGQGKSGGVRPLTHYRVLRLRLSPDASPQQLVSTFRLPSGVGATCVLKSPANGSLGPMLNLSSGESRLLAARFFDSMCLESFTQGLPLSNFVPPPPSPAPSDSPLSPDEDSLLAWNTSLPPTAGPGTTSRRAPGDTGMSDPSHCAALCPQRRGRGRLLCHAWFMSRSAVPALHRARASRAPAVWVGTHPR